MSVAYAETWAVPAAPPTPVPAAVPPPDIDAQLVGYEPIPRLGRRIAVANNKGGVGKTMATLELGAALARKGRRVLICDMDPQANATRRLAVHPDGGPTLYDALDAAAKGGAAGLQRPCGWDIPDAQLIDVLPASLEMDDLVDTAGAPGALVRLRKVLHGLTDEYDYTLIDCQPSLGHLTQQVFVALNGEDDGVLIPVVPEHDPIEGAQRVLRYLPRFAERQDERSVPVLGIVLNATRQTTLHSVQAERLADSLIDPVTGVAPKIFPTVIRLHAQIAETHNAGTPAVLNRALVRDGMIAAFDALAAEVDA